jgi:hypothetical protein
MRGRAAIFAWLFLTVTSPAAAQERILHFLSDVQVQPNGDLHVVETIRVQAEGAQIRRGILRDFPTRYRRRDDHSVVCAARGDVRGGGALRASHGLRRPLLHRRHRRSRREQPFAPAGWRR